MAAGADLDRCHLLSATFDGRESQLALPEDVAGLHAWLREAGARVLVVDVPNAFMAGGFDSHKDHDVRRAVAGPLTIMAGALDLAVLLIVHLNRAPSTVVLDRIAGSLGLARASRSVLAVVEDPDTEGERLLVLAKSNLGCLEVPSLRFTIEGAEVATSVGGTSAGRVVHLGEAPAITARNALQTADGEERTAVAEAEEWLTDRLSDGPVAANQVKAEERKADITWATVRRAKSAAGVKSRRVGGLGDGGAWSWSLTAGEGEGAHEDAKGPKVLTSENTSTLGTLEPSGPPEELTEADAVEPILHEFAGAEVVDDAAGDLSGVCHLCHQHRTGRRDEKGAWCCSRCRRPAPVRAGEEDW
jgi:hypothetical protein